MLLIRKILTSTIKITFLLIGLLAILISAKIVLVSEKSLNAIAKRYYFDKQYYITTYPEVQKLGTDPFKHYIEHGWKEGKNPSPEFNTNFYKNMYLQYNNKRNLNPLADFVDSKFNFKRKYTNPELLKKVTKLKSPKYYLSLVAVFQNEARFLKEWIEFYRLIGVEHFYLYNHLSTDNFAEILEPYIKEGIVELRHETKVPKDVIEWNSIQVGIYTEVVKEVKDISEWLMVVDTDEFLFPVQAYKLPEILKDYDDYVALSVNWVIFQDSNVAKVADNKLMIEEILKFVNDNVTVKTIVKPRYVEAFYNPHFPELYDGYEQVNENKDYFHGPFLPEATHKIFKINHYYQRDLEFYKNQKLRRVHVKGGNTVDDKYLEEKVQQVIDSNNKIPAENIDHAILKYVPELRGRVFGK